MSALVINSGTYLCILTFESTESTESGSPAETLSDLDSNKDKCMRELVTDNGYLHSIVKC